MGRTLYLSESSERLSIRRDGPSLWITARGKAGQRIPARLLARVVVIGNLGLDSGSVTLVAEHNVPLIFMTRDADEVAVVLPVNHRLPEYYRRQKMVFVSKSAAGSYLSWVKERRRACQLRVLPRMYHQLAPEIRADVNEESYQDIIRYLKPGLRKVACNSGFCEEPFPGDHHRGAAQGGLRRLLYINKESNKNALDVQVR